MIAPTGAFAQTRTNLAGRTLLQILPRLDAGGAERATLDVAAAIVQAGGRALVACDGGPLIRELQVLGGGWLPFPAATKNPLALLFHRCKLPPLLVEGRAHL